MDKEAMPFLEMKVKPQLTISKEFLIIQIESQWVAISKNNKIENPLARLRIKDKRHINVRNKKEE